MNNQEDFVFKPAFKKNIALLLLLICIVLFSFDIFLPSHTAHFSFEKIPGFYAFFGFIACVLLVLVAKHILRPLVMRSEDYYD